jgi:hypothetical protein
MHHLLYFFLLLLLPFGSQAQGYITLQDKPFEFSHTLDQELWSWLEKQEGFSALNKDQQLMYYWTNLFRKDPKGFHESVVREFLRQFPEANSPAAKSLEKDISSIKGPLPYLAPDAGLLQMSRLHAKDLAGRNGVISHTSSDGKNFNQRIKEAGQYRCGAENVFSGSGNPLEALILLLIDHGVPDKGHRMNLMDPLYTLMGTTSASFNTSRSVWVQDFGCR